MRAGIYLERFLFLFASVLWALYLLNVPASYVAAVAALLLAGGAGGSLVLQRRAKKNVAMNDDAGQAFFQRANEGREARLR